MGLSLRHGRIEESAIMIWESIPIMTGIDIIILGVVAFAVWSFCKTTSTTTRRESRTGQSFILIGLLMIAGFYTVDLYSMHVMPLYTSVAESMAFMLKLHLHYRWIVAGAGVGLVVAGFVQLNSKTQGGRGGITETARSLGRAGGRAYR